MERQTERAARPAELDQGVPNRRRDHWHAKLAHAGGLLAGRHDEHFDFRHLTDSQRAVIVKVRLLHQAALERDVSVQGPASSPPRRLPGERRPRVGPRASRRADGRPRLLGGTYQCSISIEGRAGLVVDYVTRGGQENLDAHSHCSRVFGTFE